MIQEGQQAPDFTLVDQEGKEYSLTSLHGQQFILYFYPKDDTPGCTTEACNFRDHMEEFDALQVRVFGIGKGNKNSHRKFTEKYHLPFTLLVDEGNKVAGIYDVIKEKLMFGKKAISIKRTTFLISENGIVLHIWEDVDPSAHSEEIIEYIKKNRG